MPNGLSPDRELVRNLSQVRGTWKVLHEEGSFRVVEFEKRIEGSVIWVVNDRGFFWEPAGSLPSAMDFLASE